jgi:penicillin amidase
MMALGLSADWDSEIIRAHLTARLGPQHAAWLEGLYPPGNPVIVPDIDYAALGTSALARRRNGPLPGSLGASNSWVIAGERSVTGMPLLANDPHLPLRIPGTWYENHLVGASYNVTGMSLPGVPAIMIGHNERAAWGFTAALADTQDIYIEKFHPEDPHQYKVNGAWQPATVHREEIWIKGRRQPAIEEVVVTRHGPIITKLAPGEAQPLALRWTGFDPDRGSLGCFLQLNRARNWDDALRALENLDALTLNFTYADVEGNIGYQLAGKIPTRRNGDGRVPVPGWTDEYEWNGHIPLDELPRRYNPADGFIVTANNKPTDDDYPHNLGNSWRPGFRARRITELITARNQHNRASFETIQIDQFSIPMQRLAARLAQLEFDSASLQVAQADLAYWNGVMDKDDIAPTLVYTTLAHFRRALFADALGPTTEFYLGRGFHPLLFPISGMAAKNIQVALSLLDDPDAAWLAGRSVDELLISSFASAVDQLRTELGPNMSNWRWGVVNYCHLLHPLGSVRPLGRLFNRGPFPAGGDPFTIFPNASRFHPDDEDFHSASCRLIMDLSDFSQSVSICPPGQSGQPASSHYTDQMDDWRTGHYHLMLWTREEIERAAEGIFKLVPAGWQTNTQATSKPQNSATIVDRLAETMRRSAREKFELDIAQDGLPPELAYEPPNQEYAYTVYWVKMTREWDDTWRHAVAEAVAEVLNRADFTANPTERRYTVAGLDGQFSGLSLQALNKVLRTWLGSPAE